MALRLDFDMDEPMAYTRYKPKQLVPAIAARLAQQDRGLYMAPIQIVRDAETLANAGLKAKAAIDAGRSSSATAWYKRAAVIARRYNAHPVVFGEVQGVLLGLRLANGRYGRPGAIFVIV